MVDLTAEAVITAHTREDGPFGKGFGDLIGYDPADPRGLSDNPTKYSDLDAYALREAFRKRCKRCDAGFLELIVKPPKGVDCVRADMWLSTSCGGTKCTTCTHTAPGYRKMVQSCFPYTNDPEQQSYELTTVYIPAKVHKYLLEYIMIKRGRRDFGMNPTTCSTIREISYAEPKLLGCFTEDQVVYYESALLTWYPTLLQSESLGNYPVELARDGILRVPTCFGIRTVARVFRDFFVWKKIHLGATNWTPTKDANYDVPEEGDRVPKVITTMTPKDGSKESKDSPKGEQIEPKDQGSQDTSLTAQSPSEPTPPEPEDADPEEEAWKEVGRTSAIETTNNPTPHEVFAVNAHERAWITVGQKALGTTSVADKVTPSVQLTLVPDVVPCDESGNVDVAAMQKIAAEREKQVRSVNKLLKQYEESQAKEIASIAPEPCGNPESFSDRTVTVLKGEPEKGENRSGTLKMQSRRENIMQEISTEVNRLKKKGHDVPEYFQIIQNIYLDPKRIPDYQRLQLVEQFHEKVDSAEGKPKKSAILVGPQCSIGNVGQTKLGTVADSANARIMKDGARCISAPQTELDRAEKVTLEHLRAHMPEKKVQEIWMRCGGFEGDNFLPTTWNKKKYENEKQSWRQRDAVRAMNLFVKFDVMMEGKTQRLVSDEQGMRQISRNFIAKIAEELEGAMMHEHNTKHKTKQEVHNLLFRNTKKKWNPYRPGVVVEGDGSAWDSSCGAAVRWHIEQVFETYVVNCLGSLLHGLGPEAIKHCMQRISQEMNMQWNYKDHSNLFEGMIKITCDFVMRSTGDALTSFLNRLVNLVLWTLSLTKDIYIPKAFRHPIVKYNCRWTPMPKGRHKQRHMFFIFEGDDSILKLDREILQYKDKIQAYWESWGFNMVLKFIVDSDPNAKEVDGTKKCMAEFCGHKYYIKDGSFTKVCGPDHGRRLTNALSTSLQANQSVNGRNAVAAACAGAHAESFASCSPGLSATFQARQKHYERNVWKPVKMDVKTQNEIARKARGTTEAAPLNHQYQAAINSSWYYTHNYEARLLEREAGFTDAQRRMWDGATATDHTTHPWEAAALGLKPGIAHV